MSNIGFIHQNSSISSQLKKKGYNPEEKDIPVVLAIHNTVNEKAWMEIKEWEALRNCNNPKLIRFSGRLKDMSPKAFIRSLFGYSLPFDRHDWLIDRDGIPVRYVIDFYKGSQKNVPENKQGSVAMYMDVRPAIDSFSSVYD